MSKYLTVIHRRVSKKLLGMTYKIWKRLDMANVGVKHVGKVLVTYHTIK